MMRSNQAGHLHIFFLYEIFVIKFKDTYLALASRSRTHPNGLRTMRRSPTFAPPKVRPEESGHAKFEVFAAEYITIGCKISRGCKISAAIGTRTATKYCNFQMNAKSCTMPAATLVCHRSERRLTRVVRPFSKRSTTIWRCPCDSPPRN